MLNFRTLIIIILTLSVFSNSCNDNHYIANSDVPRDLFKPLDIYGTESTTPNKYVHSENFWRSMEIILTKLTERLSGEQWEICYFFATGIIPSPTQSSNEQSINDAYNFRDNLLRKTNKGNDYIISYYLLSQYGIENNLVVKYPILHSSLLEQSIKVAWDLQYGKFDEKILINYSLYKDLKKISEIYRNSENHENIDPVLDYLEADLDRFYNKSKAVIAAEFE